MSLAGAVGTEARGYGRSPACGKRHSLRRGECQRAESGHQRLADKRIRPGLAGGPKSRADADAGRPARTERGANSRQGGAHRNEGRSEGGRGEGAPGAWGRVPKSRVDCAAAVLLLKSWTTVSAYCPSSPILKKERHLLGTDAVKCWTIEPVHL